jgi:succinate dehydrogenase / fumarate reductase flavoprotein subunit/fumarate reductase (CoM/CoB) subunit A
MNDATLHSIETDVLVIGAGGAGMSAAIAAAGQGSRVLLADRSLIGRGGATIMAQMTVAAALAEQQPDHWTHHLRDTLAAGRGLCNEDLARVLCEDGVAAIRQLQDWGVGWASGGGHLTQVQAPGHDRPRCVYVDFLNTGPAVAKVLRAQVARRPEIHRVGDLIITPCPASAAPCAPSRCRPGAFWPPAACWPSCLCSRTAAMCCRPLPTP